MTEESFSAMRRLLSLIVVLLIGAGLMYAALSSHLVRTSKGWLWLSKAELGFKDTYADVRKWDLDDADDHPELVKRLVDTGHTDVLAGEAMERFRDLFKGK